MAKNEIKKKFFRIFFTLKRREIKFEKNVFAEFFS